MANITFKGNLGNNPEKKVSASGKEFIYLSVGETPSYHDKETGEWIKQDTIWHTLFIYSPHVMAHAMNLRKGSRVSVEGTLSYKTEMTTDEGHNIQSASIIARRIESAPLVKKPNASSS